MIRTPNQVNLQLYQIGKSGRMLNAIRATILIDDLVYFITLSNIQLK